MSFVSTVDNHRYRELTGLLTADVELVPVADRDGVPAVRDPLDPLVAGWLLGFSSPNTRSAYRRDLAGWLEFCATAGVEPLQARRSHVDAWARTLEAKGAGPATVARKLAAVSSWYRYLLAEDVLPGASPCTHVRRPRVSDDSRTLGPDREEARALLAAAEMLGPKYAALIALLLLNGLRVSEAINADVGDLDVERGHRVLRVTRKGGRTALVPLAPRTSAALDAHLAGRTDGPIFLGELHGQGTVGRLTSSGATYIVQRVARGCPGSC